MKLNANVQDIVRQLLVTNPYLASKKGSSKAIKMMLNILGFTCCIMSDVNPTLHICVDSANVNSLLSSISFNNNSKTINYSMPISSTGTSATVTATVNVTTETTNLDFTYITFSVEVDKNGNDAVNTSDVILTAFAELLSTNAIADVMLSHYIDEISVNNTFTVVLTNVKDSAIPKTTREILATQINEIMPINMNINANHIFGFNRGIKQT